MIARNRPLLLLFFTTLVVSLTVTVGLSGERAQRLEPPTNLPPLQQDWKEFVYEAVNKHATEENRKMNVRYLFLDPPVPCTVSFGRKGFLGIGFGRAVQQGYGGVFLRKMIDGYAAFTRKRKSVEKDASVFFYLILPDKGTVEVYSLEQMNGGVVEPPMITVETTNVHTGGQYSQRILFRAMMSPKANLEAAAFRAIADVETFDQWPPYK